jgi:hypothetical protein
MRVSLKISGLLSKQERAIGLLTNPLLPGPGSRVPGPVFSS